jgi:hypothetical protein
MKLFPILICSLIALPPLANAATETQTFPTSAGPVKITPLYHASTLIEAGGRTIYLDPAKPTKFSSLPKADLILITDIHGDHMDPDSVKEISKPGTEIFAPPAVVQTVTAAKPMEKPKPGKPGPSRPSPHTTSSAALSQANSFTIRDAATATCSPTAASASISQATPRAFPKCEPSRTST